MDDKLTRRRFIRDSAVAGAAISAGIALSNGARAASTGKILNYNPDMEYRRLGKTGLMLSAVTLGGHWKRLHAAHPEVRRGQDWFDCDLNDPAFKKNRYEVVSRCIEVGINYVDACSGDEILAYAEALKGRREKMYFGFSWYEFEPRFHPWRGSAAKLIRGLDWGMQLCELDYVDFWRISMEMPTGKDQTEREVENAMEALSIAKKQGKARFIGVSSHDRVWLKHAVETYPDQIEAFCTPYTAKSQELPQDSLFDAVRKYDCGVLGIKPFASASLFAGDSSPNNPQAQADDQRARLAIRYILSNSAVTAPMPGLASIHQVDNMAKAIKERRELDVAERAMLDDAMDKAWAKLPPDYQWLKDWEYV